MTEQHNDGKDKRLETLYREAGDVEPDAGLDRIIRARADEAVGSRRSSNRLPWLGGLVTASVAIVAITVVLQQAPPAGEPMPESAAPLESGEPEAFMAPSLGADAELKSSNDSSNDARRARSEVRRMQSAGADASDEAQPPAALRAPGRKLSEEQRAARLGDIVAEQAANVAEPADAVAGGITEDPDAMLTRIDELLEQDEIQPARELLEAFRREYPGHAIPEKIQETLAPPE